MLTVEFDTRQAYATIGPLVFRGEVDVNALRLHIRQALSPKHRKDFEVEWSAYTGRGRVLLRKGKAEVTFEARGGRRRRG